LSRQFTAPHQATTAQVFLGTYTCCRRPTVKLYRTLYLEVFILSIYVTYIQVR